MQCQIILTTAVVILDANHEKVLLVKREKRNWQGYAAPGGHVDFPESLMNCAIREVKEETGLTVENLKLMSISHFVGLDCGEDYLVFYYLTDCAQGELSPQPGEDPVEWVCLDEISRYPLATGFKERLDAMLEGKRVEFYQPWMKDHDENLIEIPM